MGYALTAVLFTVGFFLGMLMLLEIGRRIGVRAAKDPERAAGLGALDGAVFGVMGLLIAFSFSGAAARFDARRELIVQEANDIGTAYLRIDLLPPSTQPALRESFRRYLDSRLAVYRKVADGDMDAVHTELANNARLQGDIWTQAVAACHAAESPAATTLMMSALNAMIDITTTRTMAGQMHPPPIVFVMLFGLALASSLLAGYGMAGGRSWLHMIAFALVTALAIYVILDLEFPRMGLIRVDAFDQLLVDLRQSIN